MEREGGAAVTCNGRLFHRRVAATGKFCIAHNNFKHVPDICVGHMRTVNVCMLLAWATVTVNVQGLHNGCHHHGQQGWFVIFLAGGQYWVRGIAVLRQTVSCPVIKYASMCQSIGADSTGPAGKMPQYQRHKRQNYHFAVVLFCPTYNFNASFLH